jgi:hypothetical protein
MTRPVHPEPADVLRAHLEQFALELHTAFPARVQTYDAATQRADLVPLIKHPVPQPDGPSAYEDLPVLPSVPVLFPRAGAWFLSLPLAAGDTVLVIIQEAAAGHWEAGDGDPQYPGDLRRHHLANAVAYAGYYPAARALTNASGANLVLGKDDGSRIVIKPDLTVEIAGGAQFVALANLVQTALDAIRTAYSAHTHAVAGTVGSGGAVTGTTAPTTTLLAPLGPVAAQHVKAT